MQWQRMTIDEYASYQRGVGKKVLKIDGTWWIEARPFFFRPLFPFTEIKPWSQRYPSRCIAGGFMHVVPQHGWSNSTMSFFLYDDLGSYSLAAVSSKRRRAATQGMKNFTAREIMDLDEFAETAYEVYLSFYDRTKYAYKQERVEREMFRAWSEGVYGSDKVVKIGAYHQGRLRAVEISYRVEDVIFGSTLFSDTHSLNLNVTDFLLHLHREGAAQTDARYYYIGLPCGRPSIDDSKVSRGCKVLRMPAFFKVNPMGLLAAKIIMPDSYQKLVTVTSRSLTGKRDASSTAVPVTLDAAEVLGSAVDQP
ncbi:hypothetical protein LPW11_08240 [Geomonas sp. RF6]|uniref:hypothetical protein n=1 Tax=Geomonas sp. RF6 TaxID=2897342 RepID=UPI001E41D861|nr:hypothetical protein [Geomonas sp. RF6]UFS72169.1 hypothetical protein LPW11_08240 [Geomonas sp. RF6]